MTAKSVRDYWNQKGRAKNCDSGRSINSMTIHSKALEQTLFSDKKLKIGVSACLMGDTVRFDSGHKKNQFITSSLKDYFEFVKVCPEVGAGFSIPRPAMQLRKINQVVELVISKQPDQVVTQQLVSFGESIMPALDDLDGFVFKKGSPSCGVFRVPVVINEKGHKDRNETGLFAKAFMEKYPLIPVEEEGRLNDAVLCENFFERVYAYNRWKAINNSNVNVQGFIEFHSRHKLMLMARGSSFYQELGRMVAGTTKSNLQQRRDAYIKRFMEVMAMTIEPGRQVNVLQHILGYLKDVLSSEDKKELLTVFESYRQRQIPLITAVTLLRHHLRVYPQKYIVKQHYLKPFPEALALRSYCESR